MEWRHEKAGRWNIGPCGRGEDHPVGGAALPERRPAAAGPGGPPGRLSGHRRHWSGSGASPSSPSRRCFPWRTRRSPCWTPRAMWTSPPRRSGPSRCWTAPFWSSAAPTASRATPAPSGGCWSGTTSPPSSLSTRWTWRGRTAPPCWQSSKQHLGERLRGLRRRPGRSVPGGGRRVRRGGAGAVSGDRGVLTDGDLRRLVGRAEAVPLLVRLRAEAGGGGRSSWRGWSSMPRSPPIRRSFGARVYKIARDAQGDPPHLSEGHRRHACG